MKTTKPETAATANQKQSRLKKTSKPAKSPAATSAKPSEARPILPARPIPAKKDWAIDEAKTLFSFGHLELAYITYWNTERPGDGDEHHQLIIRGGENREFVLDPSTPRSKHVKDVIATFVELVRKRICSVIHRISPDLPSPIRHWVRLRGCCPRR